MSARRSHHRLWALAALVTAAGCVVDSSPPIDNTGPDELYTDFVDGKFDSQGHPAGATVFAAAAVCGGDDLDGFRRLAPRPDGGLCATPSMLVGRGRYMVNLRAALIDPDCASVSGDGQPESDGCPDDLVVVTARAGDRELSRAIFRQNDFSEFGIASNLSLELNVHAGELSIEVNGARASAVALAYIEVFRMDRGLIIEPPSGPLAADAILTLEAVDPPAGPQFKPRCGDLDLTAVLAGLVEEGTASVVETEFRYRLEVPAAAVLATCETDAALVVDLVGAGNPGWVRATREARYTAAVAPCTFAADGKKVLLTGFVPFPAGSRSVNISQVAVESFDSSAFDGASFMKLILPVEFDTAPAIIAEVIERCDPDVVISFGQGRSRVDIEMFGYNRKDTSEVAGGVPDNRGAIFDGHAVVEGGPDAIATGLPGEAIVASLRAAGVTVGPSDDPGRYVCNNVFYATSVAAGDRRRVGFVHLPRRFSVGAAELSLVQTVVETAVRETLATL